MASNSGTKKKRASTVNSSKRGRKKAVTRKAPIRRVKTEEEEKIQQELLLLVMFAVVILLFLCNFGILGPVGNAVSSFLFGIFGIIAYLAPILIFLMISFGISNQGNPLAILKLSAVIGLLISFMAMGQFIWMDMDGLDGYSFSAIYDLGAKERKGGGVIGGSLAWLLYRLLDTFGAILVLLILMVGCFVILSGKTVVSGMKRKGNELFYLAKEDMALYRERNRIRREEQTVQRLRRQEEEQRIRQQEAGQKEGEETEKILRMDRKVSGVMLDTKLTKEEEKKEVPVKEAAVKKFPVKEVFPKEELIQKKQEGYPDSTIQLMKEAELFREDPRHEDIHEITLKDFRQQSVSFDRDDDGEEEEGTIEVFQSMEDEFDFGKIEIHRAADHPFMDGLQQGQTDKSGRTEEDAFFAEAFNGEISQKDFQENWQQEEMFAEEDAAFLSEYFLQREDWQQSMLGEEIPLQEDFPEEEFLDAFVQEETKNPGIQEELNEESFWQNQTEEQPKTVQEESYQVFWQPDGEEIPQFRHTDETADPVVQEPALEASQIVSGLGIEEWQPESDFQSSTNREGNTVGQERRDRPEGDARNQIQVPTQTEMAKPEIKPYQLPPLSCLQQAEPSNQQEGTTQLRETAERLQQTLATFGVKVTITEISQGPSVTRYELQPDQGVKVSKIVGLTDDIKLNLAATDIRIEAPIPGKAAVGIEVPNKETMAVGLRELLESKEYQEFPSKLAFAVGKDIGGKVVVADIAKMPHMLIAGATGSGKSVCINTLIMSILYKAKPDEVKLIMIDPKVVELSIYNGIPHLLIPVVTDPKKAAGALHWGVAEMTDRYNKFAEFGVRDMKAYNAEVEKRLARGEENVGSKMPQIVIIVDELADLMMVAPGEVEESICRLAQLARAAGIHLILATQRPSVDVITGLIKANMPSRVAFSVSSGVDSRTILDMNGAEKLLGKGDMLFYPQGYPKPARMQGAFVSDEEVANVVDFLKNQTLGNVYQEDIDAKIKSIGMGQGGGGSSKDSQRDAYFEEAGRFIIDKDKASIGMLQRVLKIGFNRAARIMDQLADAGVVGEEEGTKPRKVLMSMDQFDAYIEET